MAQSETPISQKVPDSLSQVVTTIKFNFLDYIRSRRFFILLLILAIISVILTTVVAYYRPQSILTGPLYFFSSWWGMSANFIVILSGIFFGGDAISGEFQNKTGYFSVPNPIRRSSIYVGKWLSAFIASSFILGIFTAVTLANEMYYFGIGWPPTEFVESFLFTWFYLVGVLGFTFMFSSLFKSSSYSILVTAILFLFGFTLIETLLTDLAKVEPWFIITYGGEIIGSVLNPAGYPAHIQTITSPFGRGESFTTYTATIPEGLIIIAIYFIATAVLGLWLFERKEFN